jgi:hypothetical protein
MENRFETIPNGATGKVCHIGKATAATDKDMYTIKLDKVTTKQLIKIQGQKDIHMDVRNNQ